MAITQIQQRNKVYDYATYKTSIPAAGEFVAVSGSGVTSETITQLTGDGTSTVDELLLLKITPTATQQALIGFSGTMIMFGGATAPDGWLICDGSAISRSTYSSLFTAIGETWGAGDASTTFNLPDMREAAPVGIGTRASGITAHDAYTLAEFKDDQGQGHNHQIAAGGTAISRLDTSPYVMGSTASFGLVNTVIKAPVTDSVNGTPRTGTTTHGKQIGVNYIIKT